MLTACIFVMRGGGIEPPPSLYSMLVVKLNLVCCLGGFLWSMSVDVVFLHLGSALARNICAPLGGFSLEHS